MIMKKKKTSTKIRKFRSAIAVFLYEKLKFRLDNGDYDDIIGSFLDGDGLRFEMSVDLLPNDVIFMRELLGYGTRRRGTLPSKKKDVETVRPR